MTLGSDAEAQAWGADPAKATAARVAAQQRVERYCADLFERVTVGRVLDVECGFAKAPVRMGEVSAVAVYRNTGPAGVPVAMPNTSWTPVRTANVDPADVAAFGGVMYDGLQLDNGSGDGTIAGAEPWNGGWANLYRGVTRVLVTADWGWVKAPDSVVLAVNMIAGMIGARPYAAVSDAEGNPAPTAYAAAGTGTPFQTVNPVPRVQPAGRAERTTGMPEADVLLNPYRRSPLRIG